MDPVFLKNKEHELLGGLGSGKRREGDLGGATDLCATRKYSIALNPFSH